MKNEISRRELMTKVGVLVTVAVKEQGLLLWQPALLVVASVSV